MTSADPDFRPRAQPRAEAALRTPDPAERPELLAWLDRGLRAGRVGRLAAEYPALVARDGLAAQRVAYVEGKPVSHALARRVVVCAAGRRIPLGMIGLVYTDPEFRGRGLASRCVEACASDLREQAIPWVALWSDRHPFYQRLGFHPAGREVSVRLDAGICETVRRRCRTRFEVTPSDDGDWLQLEALYAARPTHVERPAGALATLAAAPDCSVLVARSNGRACAYAAMGRGDDFAGVVHEWAGDPDGVVACLAELVARHGPIGWLCGPEDEEPAPALRAAGAVAHPGCFALLSILDAAALWTSLVEHEPALAHSTLRPLARGFALEWGSLRIPLSAREALALIAGPRLPRSITDSLDPDAVAALRRALPWPVFVWGFDSI